jgi:hypothetical protein
MRFSAYGIRYVKGPAGEFVENLRRELHPDLPHLAAHLTLLPTRICSEAQPFEVALGDVETFTPATPTVYLRVSQGSAKYLFNETCPGNEGTLQQLQGGPIITLGMRSPSTLVLLLECSAGLLPLANPQLRSALASPRQRLGGRSIRNPGKPPWRWRRHKRSPLR